METTEVTTEKKKQWMHSVPNKAKAKRKVVRKMKRKSRRINRTRRK